jgi:hypothetical protein
MVMRRAHQRKRWARQSISLLGIILLCVHAFILEQGQCHVGLKLRGSVIKLNEGIKRAAMYQ